MAQAVNVNFKLDADIKKGMEAACAEMGLSMSAAFTIFARTVSRERRIPFIVSATSTVGAYPQTEEQLLTRIDRSLQQIKEGKYMDAKEAGGQIRREFGL